MRIWSKVLILMCAVCQIHAFVELIVTKGRHFVTSETNQPFFIKGVDYQPGGSSGVCAERDPLSDVDACARDILLFQDLGINTIRVYSINPELNHDKCMTLLAIAGIYLVLDVNSPLDNQHLNRYTPWTTYNDLYLEHVYKVMQEFANYNNTLAFFAGNEIVNDKTSAKTSPIFIKALVRDMKNYLKMHGPRPVPIGYSAADDLAYRTSLPSYLQCDDNSGFDTSIDFYGVNSYQWCGEQTIETSGYDVLLKDYEDIEMPIFFSEYGCNEVVPRKFQEVGALYSEDMTHIFSGGLVYEFHQEANNYGLIKYDESGNVHLMEDYVTLKEAFNGLVVSYDKRLLEKELSGWDKNGKFFNTKRNKVPVCETIYKNIATSAKIPYVEEVSILTTSGVNTKKGRYVALDENDLRTTYKIFDTKKNLYAENAKIKVANHPNRAKLHDYEGGATQQKPVRRNLFNFFFKSEGKHVTVLLTFQEVYQGK